MLKNRFILTVLAAMVATSIPAVAYELQRQPNSTNTGYEITLGADYDPAYVMYGSGQYQKPGFVGGAKNGEYITGSMKIIVDGADDIVALMGSGLRGGIVMGQIDIEVKSGSVTTIYGLTNTPSRWSGKNPDLGAGNYIEGEVRTFPNKSTSNVNIKVSGGEVGEIYGGHNGSADIKAEMNAMTEAELTEIQTDPSKSAIWAHGGNINIEITGGKVGGVYEDGVLQDAIRGAGGSCNSVDGTVKITISGDDTEVYGDIYAGARNKYAYVGNTDVTIAGGYIEGDIYAGGSFDTDSGAQSVVKGKTKLTLSGGRVKGDIYAGGDRDIINDNVEIIISGNGTTLLDGGTIYGCGTSEENGTQSSILGTSKLTVQSDYQGSQQYKVADFEEIEVDSTVHIEKLDKHEDGTSVTVNESGKIITTAGVLTGLDDLTVSGTLDITVTDDNVDGPAVSANTMSIDDGTINVTNNSSDKDAQIQIFNIAGDIEGLDTLTLAVDGQQVSADMWDASGGGITIKELSTATLGLSGNQSSFYGALKAMAAGGAADEHLADLSTSRDSKAVRAQIDMLSGHELATAMMSQVEGNMGHMRRLRAAIGNGPALDSYTSFALCSPAADGKGPEYVAPQQGGKRWRAGVQAYHEDAELDASSKGDGYDRSETGAMLTAEYFVNKSLTVGGALSCGRTTLKSDNASKRHEDNTRLDAFALYGKNRWQFATALGLGLHQHDLKRTFTSAEADGYSVNFMQDAAYTLLVREKSNVQAFATLASSWNHMDGYTEKGTYALRVDDQDSWTTDVTVGVRYNHALPALGAAPAGVFSVQAGVTGTLGDVDSETEMSLNGFRYNQKSASRDRWGWSVGASVDVPVRSNMSWYAAAEAVMRGDYTSVDGQVGVKLAF